MPGGRNPQADLQSVVGSGFRLSLKDHWENNGVLDDMLDWSQHGRDRLLWIEGRSGNQDSWVTEFSADIVQALQTQPVTVLFVFCEQKNREPLTPYRLVRDLFVQLLDLHPELAMQHPEICNLARIQRVVTFRQIWRMFQDLASRVPDLFIVIDRVEECISDEEESQAGIVAELLPALISFTEMARVGLIITSIYEPPVKDGDRIQSVFIDTSIRAMRRADR